MGTAAATKIDGAENKLDTILDSANDLKFRVDAKEEELEKADEVVQKLKQQVDNLEQQLLELQDLREYKSMVEKFEPQFMSIIHKIDAASDSILKRIPPLPIDVKIPEFKEKKLRPPPPPPLYLNSSDDAKTPSSSDDELETNDMDMGMGLGMNRSFML
jgi:hypothetical protein